jgi:hypothetical protein
MSIQNVAVSVHLNEQTLAGYIQIPHLKRLSDLLNCNPSGQADTSDTFITLTDVTMSYADGTKERARTVDINKKSIHMITTIDDDSTRGVGAQEGLKRYPFVHKLPVRVNIQLPGYEIHGNLHLTDAEKVTEVLGSGLAFVPCTKTKIRDVNKHTWWKTEFVSINRSQISCFRQYEQDELNTSESPISHSNN